MTKTELIAAYAEASGQGRSAAGEQIERLGDIMAAELLCGGVVPLARLGRLKLTRRAMRKARNPRTGEELILPARWAVKFQAGRELRDTLGDAPDCLGIPAGRDDRPI